MVLCGKEMTEYVCDQQRKKVGMSNQDLHIVNIN